MVTKQTSYKQVQSQEVPREENDKKRKTTIEKQAKTKAYLYHKQS